MKWSSIVFIAAAIAAGFCGLSLHAEDYQLLKGKMELLVDQVHDLQKDSFRKGSETYGASYQYYFSLMQAIGTNLLARSESPSNIGFMRKYIDLVTKDYEAYTKVAAATEMASATGALRGSAGSRHRAKRLVNAEKMGDKELAEAIKRWERFVGDMKRSSKR